MKGFVLAAGLGSRLAPITESVAKPLMPVGRRPLIEYAIRLLAHHGIREICINTHHLAKTISERVGDGSRWGVNIIYSHEEEELLGTGGGLRRMQEFLSDASFVVVNSDTLIEVDLGQVIEAHRENGALATMVLRRDENQEAYGQIEIEASGRIRRILGQGEVGEEALAAYMFTGVHVMEPRFLDYIPPDVPTCVVRYAYSKALANGDILCGHVNDGYWADLGTPERYLTANRDVLNQDVHLSHADPLAGFAHGPTKDVGTVVRMGEDVQLGHDTRLVPPLVLGDGVRVGDEATVGPHCVIGDKVNIGRGALVTNAVLLSGASIDPGARLEHCIVSKRDTLKITRQDNSED